MNYCEMILVDGADNHNKVYIMEQISVLKKGMLLNPNAIITAKMFGYGLYFATRAKKSIKYTSLDGYYTGETADEGFLFVMKVAYKNPKVVYSW